MRGLRYGTVLSDEATQRTSGRPHADITSSRKKLGATIGGVHTTVGGVSVRERTSRYFAANGSTSGCGWSKRTIEEIRSRQDKRNIKKKVVVMILAILWAQEEAASSVCWKIKQRKKRDSSPFRKVLCSLERGGLLRLLIPFTAVVRPSQTSKSRTNTSF